MRPVFKLVSLLALVFSLPVFAKDPPTHQCLKDGAVVQLKKKACAAENGKWEPIPAKAGTPKTGK